jgi:hypothetical protein
VNRQRRLDFNCGQTEQQRGDVRPYSKGQKNDFNDAEAIAEAVQRPTMKFGGGRYFPSIVDVAPGEPGVPVICCAAAGRPDIIVAKAEDANSPSQMLLVALMVRSLDLIAEPK